MPLGGKILGSEGSSSGLGSGNWPSDYSWEWEAELLVRSQRAASGPRVEGA